ncbi:MAG: hypothetical protein ACI35R_00520 [Bacillus sp. (in: firmicutes)]
MDNEKYINKEEAPENGSMANNLEEVKILGEQMDRMNTNQELKEKGLQPDPAQ